MQELSKKIPINVLAWLMLVMSGIQALLHFLTYYRFDFFVLGSAIYAAFLTSVVGIISAIMILRKNNERVALFFALAWSLAQVIIIYSKSFTLMLGQTLVFPFSFSLTRNSGGIIFVGINIVGIIFFALFLVKLLEKKAN